MAKNVTCITQIATTKHLTGAMDYISSKRPHDSDMGQIKRRDILISSINCSQNPKIAQKEMMHTLKMAKVPKNGVQAVKEMKSFYGLDYRKPEDDLLALKVNNDAMRIEHPNGCQIWSSVQCDGHGHQVHVHNVICSRRMTDLKSITTNQMDIKYYIKPKTDKVMKAYGLNTIPFKASGQKRSFGAIYHAKHGRSWVQQVQNKLNFARLHAKSSGDYVHLVRKQGIGIEFVKMHTVNGKREVHLYKNPSKSKNVKELKIPKGKYKGEYVRLRKHFSYDIHFKGHKYKIRDKKLGSDFYVPNLLKQFQINKHQQLHPSSAIASTVTKSKSKVVKNLKSVTHQSSPSGQPVMNRTKNDESGKKAEASIKHSPKSTSSVKIDKFMKCVKMGTFTIPAYTKQVHETLKSGGKITVPIHHSAHTFHMPAIKFPHKPARPLFQVINSADSATAQAMEARLNSDKQDKYRQEYDDYLMDKQSYNYAVSDASAKAKQSQRDTAREIQLERLAEARSVHY